MFEVGWSEYLVIFGLALVVLGPEKLPKLAASIGRWVGRARVMARQFRDQLETEAESIKSSVQDVKRDFEAAASDIQTGVNDVKQDVETGLQEPPAAAAASDASTAAPGAGSEPAMVPEPVPEYLLDPAPLPPPPPGHPDHPDTKAAAADAAPPPASPTFSEISPAARPPGEEQDERRH